MVQQNLISYIMNQVKLGKSIQEINDFLINSGYDKIEVQRSIQYYINTQQNPKLAENQRIEQLSNYIKTQIKAGYNKQTISNFLNTKGYPYYEVDSAIKLINQPKEENKLISIEHKFFIGAIILMLIMTTLVTTLYFKSYVSLGKPEQLLDVETEQLTTVVKQGGDLTWEIRLINFGHEKIFDVELNYQVIDRDTNTVVLEKFETIALATTLERIITFDIPKSFKTGKYILKTDAIYKDFTATSGFIFDVVSLNTTNKIIEEIKDKQSEDDAKDEFNKILENKSKDISKDEINIKSDNNKSNISVNPELIKVSKSTNEKPFYDGISKARAFEIVKAISYNEPDRAIKMCKSYKYSGNILSCLQYLTETHSNPNFCLELNITKDADNCLMQSVINIDSKISEIICNKIIDSNLKNSCEMMRSVNKLRNSNPTQMNQNEIFAMLSTIPK